MPSYDDPYVDLWVRPVWTYRKNWYGIYTEQVMIDLFAGDVGGTVDNPSGEWFALYPHPWKIQQYEIFTQTCVTGHNSYSQRAPKSEHQNFRLIPENTWRDVRGGGAFPHRPDNNGEFPSHNSSLTSFHMWGQNRIYDVPQHQHHTTGFPNKTGSAFGTYNAGGVTNLYFDGISQDGTAEQWFDEFEICEAALKACIYINGVYPFHPTTTPTFGSYNANTNTYVAGANAALSATGWHFEFNECATALTYAMNEIERLKTALFHAIQQAEAASAVEPASDPVQASEPTAAPEIQIQTVSTPVPPPVARTEDVADDPLGELPDFVELVFEPKAEIPQVIQTDDIMDLGLLRRTRFAQPTDDVAAFSEFTYNTTTFSPRETISPLFRIEDDSEEQDLEEDRRR